MSCGLPPSGTLQPRRKTRALTPSQNKVRREEGSYLQLPSSLDHGTSCTNYTPIRRAEGVHESLWELLVSRVPQKILCHRKMTRWDGSQSTGWDSLTSISYLGENFHLKVWKWRNLNIDTLLSAHWRWSVSRAPLKLVSLRDEQKCWDLRTAMLGPFQVSIRKQWGEKSLTFFLTGFSCLLNMAQPSSDDLPSA